MDWRLLNPRIGRANREQFLLYGGASFVFLAPIKFLDLPDAAEPIFYALFLYFFALMVFRRIRDLGGSTQELIGINDPKHPLFAIRLIERRPTMYTAFLPIWLLIKGEQLENRYGFPPEGLGLKSMLSTGYTEKQLQRKDVSSLLHYEETKTTDNQNTHTEFKGRNIK